MFAQNGFLRRFIRSLEKQQQKNNSENPLKSQNVISNRENLNFGVICPAAGIT